MEIRAIRNRVWWGSLPGGVGRQRLADGVEELLLVGVAQQGFAHDIPCQNTAFTALAGHTQCIAYVAQRVGTIFHRGADLGVSNSLAEANVHRVAFPVSGLDAYVNRNENDCQ